MIVTGWLFIGVLALIATSVAVATSDNGIAIVAGAGGFITWGLWSYGALAVVVGDTGETHTMPSLTLLGVALALIPGYIALTGPVEVIDRATDADTEDL